MAADTGYTKPTNQILVAGQPLIQILKIETAANCYPGRLVKRDSGDGQIEVNDTDDNVIGWLGYEQTIKKYRPTTVDTVYAGDEHAAVLHGGHFVIVGSLASGQNVTKGAKLTATSAGQLTAATIGTHMVVAIAEESVNATAGAADIMVRSLI